MTAGWDSASPAERDRYERFEAAYNAIDEYLQHHLKNEEGVGFVRLVQEYEQAHPHWTDGRSLRKFARLRNVLVHGKTRPYELLSIPTLVVVEEIERIRARLRRTPTAIEHFPNAVVTLDPDDLLVAVLEKIRQCQFSQFPVYEGSVYIGLLTENGITRWLANAGLVNPDGVDFDEHRVAEVLAREEERPNCEFLPRSANLDQAIDRFRKNPYLEALLITATGLNSEPPLAIATRWDIFNLL
jgi:predicted transcriptional regulator